MTTAAIPLESAVKPERHIRFVLDGNLLLVLLILYPLLRFVIGAVSYTCLIAALAILLYSGAVHSYLGRFIFFGPLAALSALGALAGRAAGLPTEANYFAFTAIYLFIIPCLTSIKTVYRPAMLRLVLAFFCASCLAFFLVPALADLASAKYASVLEETMGVAALEAQETEGARRFTALAADRFHAYFIHSNEFGLFVAGLFFILMRADRDEKTPLGKTLNMAIGGTLVLLALMSGSLSTYFVVAMTLAMRFIPASLARLGAFGVFSLFFVTQLFMPVQAAQFLQEGSMFWRYLVADVITTSSSIIQFVPTSINLVGNWPHSIFLDFVFLAGLIGPVLLYVAVSVFSLVYLPADRGTGVLIFFTCAALQPAGAMPSSFLILALALCGWNTGAFSRRGLSRA